MNLEFRKITVNQLILTLLKFSVLPLETYLVQENLAFFKSFPTVYNMPMLIDTLNHVYSTLKGSTWTI